MISINDIAKRYGSEIAAIILCCRVYLDTATVDELDTFISNKAIDWPEFIRLATIHNVRPVVYKAITGSGNLPAGIKSVIRNEQTNLVKYSFKQSVETERIILLLNQSGIEAVPYKGAAFSKQFFGDLVSRESSDIDLIIAPDDLPKAIAVLQQDSYVPEIHDVYQYLGLKYFDYYKDYNLNKFNGKTREFHLELHWGIAESFIAVDPAINRFIFDADNEAELVKTKVKMLNNVSHFSAIIIHHSLKDTFKNLKNIIDISKAINQPGMQDNGDILNEKFSAIHLKKVLQLSNSLSHQLMGISLTQVGQLNLTDNLVQHFMGHICCDKLLPVENKWHFLIWIKNRMLLQDSAIRKLRFLLIAAKHRFIPGEKDFQSFRLPKPVFFIYYLIKPFRSFIKPLDVTEKKKKLIPAN